jgi:hypothetical protein
MILANLQKFNTVCPARRGPSRAFEFLLGSLDNGSPSLYNVSDG